MEEEHEKTSLEKAQESFKIIDIVFYTLVLCFGVYMIVVFLVWKGKGRILYVTTFYVFACLTVIARVTNLVFEPPWLFLTADRVAFSSKIFLELCQIAQMFELAVQVKVSAFKMKPKHAKMKMR